MWLLATLMVLVGLGGPLVMPPVTGVLLSSVPSHLAGTASGVFNTSRQVGGALAVAVFGAFIAESGTFTSGLQVSLLIAAAVALATAGGAARLTADRSASTWRSPVEGGNRGQGDRGRLRIATEAR